MHEVWSQELQCYRMRNASQVRLKYTCFYLYSVRVVSGLIFRISTETVHSDGEKTYCKPCQTKTMLPFHSGSLWCVSLIGSLYFMVFKNRYTHSLIIPQYSVGCSTVKKLKSTVLFSNFLSHNIWESFQYFLVAEVSDQIFLFLKLIFNRSSL